VIGVAKLAAGPGGLALVERPTRALAPGEVRIEVHGAGICGTDLHIEAGELPVVPPVTLGHEVAGVVGEVGPGVDPAWQGARVVSETYFSTCRSCPLCRAGRWNLCPERRSIGIHVDGAFAAHVIVPAGNLHRIPGELPAHAAALAEPLACVCHCLLDPPAVEPGDAVLVLGPGPIGLLAAQVARVVGGQVLVAGLPSDAERLRMARELGFETTDEPPASERWDVVIECAGSAGAASAGLGATHRGGRFVQVGIYGAPAEIPLDTILLKEIELRTGFASTPASWRRAMGLIARGAVALEPLVNDVAPLAQFERAIADLRAGRAAKIVLDPRLG
jgi:L-iditol 2-dehydrogenase